MMANEPTITTGPKIRHEWYQTDAKVIVSVFAKNVPKDQAQIQFTEKTLSVTFPLPSGSDYSLELDLAHAIEPQSSTYVVLGTKIEISLNKSEMGLKWNVLEGEDTLVPTTLASQAPASRLYPSSSKSGPKNWDKIDQEVSKETEKDQDGLNTLFQQIYKNANPEVQRAMIKSYTESNGTCLSTNWDEVGQGKVETKPPEGMVAKKYEA
jgi:suppressor of G2 allele of SKP1